ncbi:hypothetical protein C8J56DRAFT_1030516 [Mycena floridula]|nr:hypothetical protein C8J56DRAFT_1030516 [Mycena floridula]
MASILRDIAQLPHVVLFLTMRATLYSAIDQNAKGDTKLPELLQMLGYMALAVKLMARHVKNTECTVEELLSSYQVTGPGMLGPTRGSGPQNSISISICISLESSLVNNELDAAHLLSIIAMLPSGTTVEALQQWWATELNNRDGALRVLLEVSLLERRSNTFLVLPVIRSYLLLKDVCQSMVTAACGLLKHHSSHKPGEESFRDDMQARAIQEINLQAILLDTAEPNPNVIQALVILAWHQYRIRPRLEVIQHAVKLVKKVNNQKLIEKVLGCYAETLFALNHFEESLKQLNLARDSAFLAASATTDASSILLNIAAVSVHLDSCFNETPIIEQAKREMESIHQNGDTRVQKMRIGCLLDLGKAHSRRIQHSAAIRHLTKARDLSDNFPFERADCARRLAEAYLRLEQFDEAEKNMEGVTRQAIVCQYYLDKLDHPLRVSTLEERSALWALWHIGDLPTFEFDP